MRTVIINKYQFGNIFKRKEIILRPFEKLYAVMGQEQSGLNSSSTEHLKNIKKFIPKLTPELHKGQCGRIGVIGGSTEYTGAPYFASIAALKLGADLVYVFCSKEAAPVIKSYSPELIVLPVLNDSDVVSKVEPWLPRLNSLIIGPGLGRNPDLLLNVADIIRHCSKMSQQAIPLIIDADGLFLVEKYLDLIEKYTGPVVLTPNLAEFKRLESKFFKFDSSSVSPNLDIVLLKKGVTDVISNLILLPRGLANRVILQCDIQGSNRRCGGQGDLLSGFLGTFVAWYQLNDSKTDSLMKDYGGINKEVIGHSLAAYGACAMIRTCNRLAYEALGRSLTASDMIPYIHKAFKILFDE